MGVEPAVSSGSAADEAVEVVRRRGRRPDGQDTRGMILEAARVEFAERGFAAASVRAVARRAGVDPALVRHYFADKGELYAAGLIPQGTDPEQLVDRLVAGGVDGLGERLLRTVLGLWEVDGGERFRVAVGGLVGDAGGPGPGAQVLSEFLGRRVFGRVAVRLGDPVGALRMSLVASQVVGVLVARHVLRVAPLAELSVEEVVALVGPTLQGYLTGHLALPLREDTPEEQNSSHEE
ncbi:TetR family transcriptional regulator [Cellulomonas soli]|uniref:TetR/AcrR family transcriptional regulator n=1 Tax=Cellulomonas soli TaxID=931535 RepID=UPI003F869891